MDIKFIRDDTEEKAVKELTEILDVLSSKRNSSEVYAAKKFLLALIAASKGIKEQAEIVEIGPNKPEVITKKPFVAAQKIDFSAITLQQGNSVSKESTKAEVIPAFDAKAKQERSAVSSIPKQGTHNIISVLPKKEETPSTVPQPVEQEPSIIPILPKQGEIVQEPIEVEKKTSPIPERVEVKQEAKQEEVLPKLEARKPRKVISSEVGPPLVFIKDRYGGALVLSSITKTETGLMYRVMEPVVDRKALSMAKILIGKDILKKPEYLEDEKFMRKNIEKAMKRVNLKYSEDYGEKLKYFLRRDLFGFGQVEVLMHDPRISSIICDGVGRPLRILIGNREVITNVVFSNPDELNSFVKYIASKGGYVPSSGPNFGLVLEDWKIEGTVGSGGVSSRFIMRKS